MPKTLAEAESSVEDFLVEAADCASSGNGFAAMLACFAVIGALSEAIAGRSLATLKLFRLFVAEMDDTSGWMRAEPGSTPSPEDMARLLAQTRHALVHQLSLPSGVVLVESLEVARTLVDSRLPSFIIGISDFVEAVSATARKILVKHPTLPFDPSGDDDERGAASTYVVTEPE